MDSSDQQSVLDGLFKISTCSFISLLSLQLNEFGQLEIKQKLSLVQKFTCIIAIADKKIIQVYSLCLWVLCSLRRSAVQIK